MAKSVLARLENRQFQLTIIIPKEKVGEVYQGILKKAAEEVEVPGFRKGMAPIEKAAEKLDKDKLYQQVVQKLIPEAYVEAVKEHELKPIVSPKVELISAKESEDWQIRATACEVPEVVLSDYKEKLKGMLAKAKIWTPGKLETNSKKQEAVVPDQPNQPDQPDQKQPPQGESRESKEQEVLKWLIEHVEVKLAAILIDDETQRMLSGFLDQMQKLGLTVDQYVQSVGKTIEQLKSEYVRRAKENLQLEFALAAMSKDLNIVVKPEEIDQIIATVKDEELKKELEKDYQRRSLEISISRRKTLEELVKMAS